MGRREVERNALINDVTFSIQKIAEAGEAWFWKLTEYYFGKCC
jgi:hypothetical protein